MDRSRDGCFCFSWKLPQALLCIRVCSDLVCSAVGTTLIFPIFLGNFDQNVPGSRSLCVVKIFQGQGDSAAEKKTMNMKSFCTLLFLTSPETDRHPTDSCKRLIECWRKNVRSIEPVQSSEHHLCCVALAGNLPAGNLLSNKVKTTPLPIMFAKIKVTHKSARGSTLYVRGCFLLFLLNQLLG